MDAIIYSRVSTLDQDNARQISDLQEYAKYKRYKVVKVFQEKVSGAINAKERPEFAKLLEYIKKEKINHLLVWELSRLGRSMLDVINTIEEFDKKGINIFIHNKSINTIGADGKKDPLNRMLITILSGLAEVERENIKQRSISGIRASVAKGGIGTGGVKAYGYYNDKGQLAVNLEEAKIVKMIFEKYVNGLGTTQIANHLNSLGVQTKFNKEYKGKSVKTKHGLKKKAEDYTWVDGTIYSILKNSIYIGERKHKGEIFKIEPIITASVFNKVQTLLKEKSNRTDSTNKFINPLKDLLKCGVCGKSYFLHKRGNGKDNAYKCLSMRLSTKKYGDTYCGSPAINYDKLIDSINKIAQTLINSDLIDRKSEFKTVLKNNIDNKTIERDNVIAEIADIEKQSEKLLRLNLNGKLNDKQFTKLNSEFIDKTKLLNARLKKLNSDLDSLQKTKLPEIDETYSLESLGAYLKEAVEYVKIYPVADGKFTDLFPMPSDVQILVEIKGALEWSDGSPIYYHYLLSRYTKTIAFPTISVNKNMLTNIQKTNYKIDYHTNLEKLKVLGMKNYFLKKKGEPYIEAPTHKFTKGDISVTYELKDGRYIPNQKELDKAMKMLKQRKS